MSGTGNSTKKPQIIAFEGVDGAGKSTAIAAVAERLRGVGRKVFLPRTGKEHRSRVANGIRELTRDRCSVEMSSRAEFLLYCAREAQVLAEQVRPALARGETVLLDRSLVTPVVFGAYGRGLPLAECERQAEWAAGGVEPDTTLVFSVHPRTSRIRKRLDKIREHQLTSGGRKGLSGSGFKERVQRGYCELARRRNYPLFHVERATPEEMAARVIAVLEGADLNTLQTDKDAVPLWSGPKDWTLDQALSDMPADIGLLLTGGMVAGRALRAQHLQTDAQLVAWALDSTDPLRSQLVQTSPEYALSGLKRCPLVEDDLRWQWREQHTDAVLRSLRHLTGGLADELRQHYASSLPGAVLDSLCAREDALALELRAACWSAGTPEERRSSLTGCSGEDAWKRRRKLFAKQPISGVQSLRGVRCEEGDELLQHFRFTAPKPVLSALSGRSDSLAQRLRAQLTDAGREVMDSLRGLSDDESWALRERFAEEWPSTVTHSLEGLEASERRQRILRRCREAGAGDAYFLRRERGLQEYTERPLWMNTRPVTEWLKQSSRGTEDSQ